MEPKQFHGSLLPQPHPRPLAPTRPIHCNTPSSDVLATSCSSVSPVQAKKSHGKRRCQKHHYHDHLCHHRYLVTLSTTNISLNQVLGAGRQTVNCPEPQNVSVATPKKQQQIHALTCDCGARRCAVDGRRDKDNALCRIFDIYAAHSVREVGWRRCEGVDGESLAARASLALAELMQQRLHSPACRAARRASALPSSVQQRRGIQSICCRGLSNRT